MTRTHTGPPDAALVHLSGRRRGATEFLSGNRIVLSSASDSGIVLSNTNDTPPHSLAVLERRGQTFSPVFSPGVYCGRRMAAICRAFRKSCSSSRRQQRSELRPHPKEEAMSHALVAVRRGRRNVV